MTAKLKLSIACDDFEIIRALKDGTVSFESLDLSFAEEMSNPVRHRRMVRDLAFDICELNIVPYIIARSQGCEITAIPVFLFRKFRHGNIFINPHSSIRSVQQLVGQRVGCPSLLSAGNVWINGIIGDEDGVLSRSFKWMVERDEDVPFPIPDDIQVDRADSDKSVVSMLMDQEIAAVISPTVPKALIAGDPRIGRLFPDYVDREKAYFRRTGIFPIMHVMALRLDIVRMHPQIVDDLVRGFESAKFAAYERLSETRIIPQAWFGATWEEERQLLSADPWQYGLTEANLNNLRTIIRYTYEQGMIPRLLDVQELFTV
jgi:4,5-dihydroxyphthalate decarboxylase